MRYALFSAQFFFVSVQMPFVRRVFPFVCHFYTLLYSDSLNLIRWKHFVFGHFHYDRNFYAIHIFISTLYRGSNTKTIHKNTNITIFFALVERTINTSFIYYHFWSVCFFFYFFVNNFPVSVWSSLHAFKRQRNKRHMTTKKLANAPETTTKKLFQAPNKLLARTQTYTQILCIDKLWRPISDREYLFCLVHVWKSIMYKYKLT